MEQVVNIRTETLVPHPDNPRKDLGDLRELTTSIQAMGVLNPILVVRMIDGTYRIIAGHRRAAAAKKAGLSEVPCIITKMSALEQQYAMWTENEQRAQLTPREQAGGIQMMLDLGATVDDVAEKTGLSRRTVKNRVEIARLDQSVLTEIERKPDSYQLSIQDYEELARIKDIKKRNELLRKGIYSHNDLITKVDFAVRKQTEEKNMEIMTAEMKKRGFLKTTDNRITWDSAHWDVLQKIDLTGKGLKVTVEPDPDRQIFYYMGWSKLYIAAPIEQTEEEEEEDQEAAEHERRMEHLRGLRKEYMEEVAAYIKNVMDGKIQLQVPKHAAQETLWKVVVKGGGRIYMNLRRFVDNFLYLGEKLKNDQTDSLTDQLMEDNPIETQMLISVFTDLEFQNMIGWAGKYCREIGVKHAALLRILQDCYGYWPTNEEYIDLIKGTHEMYQKEDE